MFGIVRIFIGCAFLGIAFLVLRRLKIVHKSAYTISIVVSIILTTALAFVPFENFLISFSSPKAAYEYFNIGKSNIELVVEGSACDFVIDRKKDADSYLIVPKKSDSWKIGIGADTRKIVNKLENGITVNVYQYKNTNEYFITMLDTNGGQLKLSDFYGTKFYSLKKENKVLQKSFITYYAYIPHFNSGYRVTVNETEIIM